MCLCVCAYGRAPAGGPYLLLSVPAKKCHHHKEESSRFFLRAERSWSVLCSLPLSHTRTRCSCVTELSVRFLLVQQQSFFFAKAFCDPRDDLGRSEVKCGSSRTDVLSCRRRCASSVEKKACYDPVRQTQTVRAAHCQTQEEGNKVEVCATKKGFSRVRPALIF